MIRKIQLNQEQIKPKVPYVPGFIPVDPKWKSIETS